MPAPVKDREHGPDPEQELLGPGLVLELPERVIREESLLQSGRELLGEVLLRRLPNFVDVRTSLQRNGLSRNPITHPDRVPPKGTKHDAPEQRRGTSESSCLIFIGSESGGSEV